MATLASTMHEAVSCFHQNKVYRVIELLSAPSEWGYSVAELDDYALLLLGRCRITLGQAINDFQLVADGREQMVTALKRWCFAPTTGNWSEHFGAQWNLQSKAWNSQLEFLETAGFANEVKELRTFARTNSPWSRRT